MFTYYFPIRSFRHFNPITCYLVLLLLFQAGTQFKSSLSQLMVILMSKEPSYVRCIKPNDNKMKGTLNAQTGSCYIGRRGHDHMVVGFTTTCAISAYHY